MYNKELKRSLLTACSGTEIVAVLKIRTKIGEISAQSFQWTMFKDADFNRNLHEFRQHRQAEYAISWKNRTIINKLTTEVL